jgi:hypothetical protein
MRAKLSFLVFILTLTAFNSIAQAYKENIRKRFGEFYALNASGKIEESMEYIPDSVFAIVPKVQMVKLLKQVMNNKELEFKILDYKITQISDSRKIANSYYAPLMYVSNMTMKFRETDTLQADKKKARLGLIQLSLANTFGTDNVKLNEATGVFSIASHKKSCAISSNGETGWKFINIDPKQRLIMDKVLPKEIIETL